MSDTVEVRVNVPVARETEFYRWFADWRDGAATPTLSASAQATPTAASGEGKELDSAVGWWRLLRPSERAVWGLWIEASPRLLKASEIVEALDQKGPRDIPGILSWVSRKGDKVGFKVDWRFLVDPSDGSATYGVEDVAYADVIRRAREIAEPDRGQS